MGKWLCQVVVVWMEKTNILLGIQTLWIWVLLFTGLFRKTSFLVCIDVGTCVPLQGLLLWENAPSLIGSWITGKFLAWGKSKPPAS